MLSHHSSAVAAVSGIVDRAIQAGEGDLEKRPEGWSEAEWAVWEAKIQKAKAMQKNVGFAASSEGIAQ